VRELRFWQLQAARKSVEDRLAAITAARFAMATNESANAEIARLHWMMKLIDAEERGGQGERRWPV